MSEVAVYVMSSDLGPVKIGLSNNPRRRADTINGGAPFNVVLEYVRWVERQLGRPLEAAMHLRFSDLRRNGEWFDVDAELAVRALEEMDLTNLVPTSASGKRLAGGFSSTTMINIAAWRAFRRDVASHSEAVTCLAEIGLSKADFPVTGIIAPGCVEGGFETRLSDYRRAAGLIPRAEAIRRLVEQGLKSD